VLTLMNILMSVRQHLESTVERCCIMVIVFTKLQYLPVFILGYTSYVVHIFKYSSAVVKRPRDAVSLNILLSHSRSFEMALLSPSTHYCVCKSLLP